MPLKHILYDIADVVRETFPKSITLKYEVPADLWPIVAQPTQIHQVLLNLCVNSRDAMPKGGTILLTAENCTLDRATADIMDDARPGAWVALHVEDTGTGIPPDILPRIWEPFFTTKSAEKGTGLGLATVRGIVEAHDGFITLKSEVGRGTRFGIYLPAAETTATDYGQAKSKPPARGQGEAILLVDDEETIRETTEAALRDAGYTVHLASDGQQATGLLQLETAEFALVITDIDMPNLDGEALAILVHTVRPGLPILVTSGLSSRASQAPVHTFADGYLSKPFTADELLRTVDRLIHAVPSSTQEVT